MIKFCKKCQAETERYARGDCKPCAKAYVDSKPAEKKQAWMKAHYEKNKLKERARKAIYRAANKEELKARSAAYRLQHPEKSRETVAAWRAANPVKAKSTVTAYRAANRGAQRIYDHNRKSRKRESGGQLSKNLAVKLFAMQKGKCPCCNMPLGDSYHLDHIMPLALGGANTDSNMQLLRQRCNLEKGKRDPVVFMQRRGFLI